MFSFYFWALCQWKHTALKFDPPGAMFRPATLPSFFLSPDSRNYVQTETAYHGGGSFKSAFDLLLLFGYLQEKFERRRYPGWKKEAVLTGYNRTIQSTSQRSDAIFWRTTGVEAQQIFQLTIAGIRTTCVSKSILPALRDWMVYVSASPCSNKKGAFGESKSRYL